MNSDQRRPILITGCARTGTSLLTLLMDGFKTRRVITRSEVNPAELLNAGSDLVIKYPQARRDFQIDFELPADRPELEPSRQYLDYYLSKWLLLICVRDARDVLVSQHHERPGIYYVKPERYYESVKRDIAALRSPHTIPVYYEDLVTEPARVMGEIAIQLGEEYDLNHLNTFYQGLDTDTQIVRALNGPRPIDSKSVGRWRDARHRARLVAIADYYRTNIEPLMWQLGYEDTALS